MDKYDRHIAKLTDHPSQIMWDWANGIGLFQFVTPDPMGVVGMPSIGCLTMIRGAYQAQAADRNGNVDPELTQQIRADDRIPQASFDIRVKHLPVFAEWQRKLDAYYGRSSE